MKNLKLLAALLALTIGLAGCGKGSSASSSKPEKMLDGDNMIASPSAKQEYTEPEDVTYMRLLAGEDEYRACVLYLGGSYEVTTDVQKVLDSQTDLRDLWSFVYDIPQDHWVVAPDGGCDLYCIFPQDPDATPVSYTHLDVYKRQAPQHHRGPDPAGHASPPLHQAGIGHLLQQAGPAGDRLCPHRTAASGSHLRSPRQRDLSLIHIYR